MLPICDDIGMCFASEVILKNERTVLVGSGDLCEQYEWSLLYVGQSRGTCNLICRLFLCVA
jgi:hypothetical protein